MKSLPKEKLLQAINTNINNRKKINEILEAQFVELAESEKFNFRCSDHAVVRYLQRINLVPPSEARYTMLKEVEDEIKDKNIKIEFFKDVHYKLPVKGKFYLIKNNNIITVFTEDRDE